MVSFFFAHRVLCGLYDGSVVIRCYAMFERVKLSITTLIITLLHPYTTKMTVS